MIRLLTQGEFGAGLGRQRKVTKVVAFMAVLVVITVFIALIGTLSCVGVRTPGCSHSRILSGHDGVQTLCLGESISIYSKPLPQVPDALLY